MAGLKRNYKKGKVLTGGGEKLFRRWADWNEGDIFVGKYIKTYKDQTYDTLCHEFEVIEASFKMDKKDISEKTLVLNSMGKLNKAIEKAKKGKCYEFEYLGMGEMPTGKYKNKDAHDCLFVEAITGEEEDLEEDEDIDMDEDEDLDEEEEDDL